MNLFFGLCLLLACAESVKSAGLLEEYTWSRISYVWPRGRVRRQNVGFVFPSESYRPENVNYGNKGNSKPPANIDYQYENNIPMGANVWKNKLFITVPRRRLGVPSTLNYIDMNDNKKHNVPLNPYPSWSKNMYPAPSGQDAFVSIYRIAVDNCDRLWFVDTGTIEIPGNVTHIKPHTLYIMDLKTDKVIHSYEFPEDVLRPATSLVSVTLDIPRQSCQDAFAYLPDLAGYGLIVYSLKDNRSWRVSHNYFFLEPQAGEFFIAGHNFQWNDGIFSAELSSEKPDGSRDLYFHSMAGTHMYKVSTQVLRNDTLATRSYHGNDFINLGDRGMMSQTSSADLHKESGIMMMGYVNQNAVACWNTQNSFKNIGIVQKDDAKMIYPSDVKISGDRVYVLTNTMPEFLYGRLNYDQTNFRVWSNTIKNAIKGTSCERGQGGAYGNYRKNK